MYDCTRLSLHSLMKSVRGNSSTSLHFSKTFLLNNYVFPIGPLTHHTLSTTTSVDLLDHRIVTHSCDITHKLSNAQRCVAQVQLYGDNSDYYEWMKCGCLVLEEA